MRIRSTSAGLLLAVVVLSSGTVWAQERGSAGLVIGYPGSIGFIWHASEKLALRPELQVTNTSGTSETGVQGVVSENSGWTAGVGVSALFYTSDGDKVRTYLSPRFSYGRQTSEASYGSNSLPSSTTSNNDFSAGLSFGTQYLFDRRFGVFGEAGLAFGYRSSKRTSTGVPVEYGSSSESTLKSIGTRYALGVLFYF